MDLEDLFDNRRKNRGGYMGEHGHHDGDNHGHNDRDNHGHHHSSHDEHHENEKQAYHNLGNMWNQNRDNHGFYDRSGYSFHNENKKWLDIFERIKSNKKLKSLLIISLTIGLIIIIGLIIVLWPLFLKLVNFIYQNGLQGITDSISGFIDSVLNGSTK